MGRGGWGWGEGAEMALCTDSLTRGKNWPQSTYARRKGRDIWGQFHNKRRSFVVTLASVTGPLFRFADFRNGPEKTYITTIDVEPGTN